LAKKNAISSLLGIELPLIQAGMLWLANAELAAAVSNAGALGTVSPYAGMAKDGDPVANLEHQIKRVRQLTGKPFAVNIPLDLSLSGILLDRAACLGARIVITAAGNPMTYTALLKGQGAIVLHVIASVDQARKAQSAGVDAIIAQGIEAGGLHGRKALPLFSLLPQVADAVTLPIVAAGGIADARGMVAAIALGADAVQLGTRFIAVSECVAHPSYKRAILDAGDQGTVLMGADSRRTRILKTAFAEHFLALENSGATPEQLQAFRGFRSAWNAQLDGHLESGEAHCGASAGLIQDIVPAGELVMRLFKDSFGTIDLLCSKTITPRRT